MQYDRATLILRLGFLGSIVGVSLGLPIQKVSGQNPLTFEVASVKRMDGAGPLRGGCNGTDSNYPSELKGSVPPLGRCVVSGPLEMMVALAYSFRSTDSIRGVPLWGKEGAPGFTVEAKAEDPATATIAQLHQMLRNLLVERFKIRSHMETRDVPGFTLITDGKQPKLRLSAAGGTPYLSAVSRHPVTLKARSATMASLAGLLRNQFNAPVVDKTGLEGGYDFDLSWDDQDGPFLSTVLGEIGLKLRPQKLPEPVLVIDSAQIPSAN